MTHLCTTIRRAVTGGLWSTRWHLRTCAHAPPGCPRAPECAVCESWVLDPLRTPAVGPGLLHAGRDAQGTAWTCVLCCCLCAGLPLHFSQPRDIYGLPGSTSHAPTGIGLAWSPRSDHRLSLLRNPQHSFCSVCTVAVGLSVERTCSHFLGGHGTSSGPAARSPRRCSLPLATSQVAQLSPTQQWACTLHVVGRDSFS